jgi:hypothetical protein
MPKQNPSTLLAERLRTLLVERKALQPLLARYRIFVVTRNFNDERTDLEKQIGELVACGLPFNEKERRYNLPPARYLAECAFYLRAAFIEPRFQDRPALVWDAGSLVPGIMTVIWHQAVKDRLVALAGPLDDTLARMLSA